MRYRVNTIVPDHSGMIGRIMVHEGTAEFDGHTHASELRYLRSAGHDVQPLDEEAEAYDALQAKVAEIEADRLKAELAAEAAANPAQRIAALEAQVAEMLKANQAADEPADEPAATTKTSARKGASSTDGGAS